MWIRKIDIQSYKSIKEPVEINFYNGLPTVLIGKNGSGKTNILEALNVIAEANSNYFGNNKELTLSYKVHIHLSKEDMLQLFPGKDTDDEKCQFIACSGEKCKIDRIESEYLVPLLKSEISEIIHLANELKYALDIYKKQLNKIAYNEREELSAKSFQIADFQSSTTNYDNLKFQTGFIIEQTEKLTDFLMQNFESDDNSFRFGYFHEFYKWDSLEKLSFKLRYVKPDLAPFEEKFVSINETALKQEITKINRVTRESCDKITTLARKLDERLKRLKEALTDEPLVPYGKTEFYSFIREMRKCIGARCSFFRNENSDIIFKSDEQKQEEYYRNNKSFMILQTYLNKVYKGADKEELLKQLQSNKDFSLSDAALCEFEQYLNKNIPKFEDGMYDDISIECSDRKNPTILLHEKSGDTVSLNSTSAGRRWYFTYYFIKNTLAPGDLFIIDEPAAMLHPIAQKEVLDELLKLAAQGIKVVYSTHSPYLIPNDWECVHFVSIGNNGTLITQENQYDHLKQVTGGDIFNLQELLEKYKKCGAKMAAYHCYDALMKKYGSIETASNNVPFSYNTIESWKKKKRGTLFANVILIANVIGISPEKLL